jgi:hypothetical protein
MPESSAGTRTRLSVAVMPHSGCALDAGELRAMAYDMAHPR